MLLRNSLCCCPRFTFEENPPAPLELLPYNLDSSTELGRGSFGVVYRGALSDGRTVALKVPRKDRKAKTSGTSLVKEEISILTHIGRHDSIIEIIHTVNGPKDIIVFELADSDLFDYVKAQPNQSLSEEETRSFYRQMLEAVRYCHEHCVAHRDIKLDNWLLVNERVKLSDFGLSHLFDAENRLLHLPVGSASYMSPEALRARTRAYDGYAADAWSLSVCLFTMICGFFPYRSADRIDGRFAKCYGKCECLVTALCKIYKISNEYSKDVCHLLHHSLAVQIENRLKVCDMQDHAWMHATNAPSTKCNEGAQTMTRARGKALWASVLSLPIIKRCNTQQENESVKYEEIPAVVDTVKASVEHKVDSWITHPKTPIQQHHKKTIASSRAGIGGRRVF